MVRQAVMGEVEGPATGDEERLRHRPNVKLMQEAANEDESANEDQDGDEEGEEDQSESEIEDDTKPASKLVGKKRKASIEDSSSEEEEAK
jgi:hypothetical protein